MGRTARTTRQRRAPAAVPPRFRAVVAAFAKNREVTRERMFSSDNVLTARGKIFAMLVGTKLVTKLPKQRATSSCAAASARASTRDTVG